MNEYRESLKEFIENIKNRTIKNNSIVVGEIAPNIIEFLETKQIVLATSKIYFTVNAYNHILRDFKKEKGKAISSTMVEEIYRSLEEPHYLFFDREKSRLNLIYVDKKDEIFFKIVVAPNYKTKKGCINNIITAGIIEERNLKSKFYEAITLG